MIMKKRLPAVLWGVKLSHQIKASNNLDAKIPDNS